MTKQQLWKAALGQLELRVSQGNYLTWFRHTKIKERKGGRIILETDNPFTHEWLSKKYRSIILEVLQGLDATINDISVDINAQERAPRLAKRAMRVVAQKVRLPVAKQEIQPRKVTAAPLTLNPKHTFSEFVVGPSNEVAYAACRAVAEKPGEAYNPVFIYGGVGLGKTHLLQAVGNEILRNHPDFKIMYIASEKFMNEFVDAVRHRTVQDFKERHRDIDVLIIDDVQLLSGKDKTQEELFFIFNMLHTQNKQVIVSSDRPPGAINAFQERLSSRFSAGMVVDVKKPDIETRIAILEEKLDKKAISIDRDAIEFIAKNIQSNVRELEGALTKLIAHCELHKERATIEYTKKVLHDLIDQPSHRTINTREIIEVVSNYYNLSSDEICGQRRNKEIVRPRQVAMYLLRKESNISFPSIGEYFGGRDHTTAMHACDKIEKLLEHDEELMQEINFLKERLYA